MCLKAGGKGKVGIRTTGGVGLSIGGSLGRGDLGQVGSCLKGYFLGNE